MSQKLNVIYIIRHTDTVVPSSTLKGQGEYDVSKKGKRILDGLNRNLKSIDISPNKIISSDLNRAVHTAKSIHDFYNNDPVFEKYEDLRETDFGDITSYEELAEFGESLGDMETYEKYKIPFPNGESTYDVCQRVRSLYAQINKDEDNIIVTHMTPILCILSEVRDCSVYDIEDNINHCECIPITEKW